MLECFRKAKQKEIAELRTLAARNAFPEPLPRPEQNFRTVLSGPELAVIGEYKRASPSRGIIRHDLDVETVAASYQRGGAAAMSVLTEKDWFQGDFNFLDRAANAANLPVLRKDFIFDELQIRATAASRASAILLIVRLGPDAKCLEKMIALARKFGLAPVVEVFDAHDLVIAREAGADIIQVNARDLDTLEVNRKACVDLITAFPPKTGELWIAASGMEKPEHLRNAADAGFNAALIGTSIMSQPDPGAALATLIKGSRPC